MKEKSDKPRVAKAATLRIFSKENYYTFLAGMVVILIGYLAMMQGPYNSFLSLKLSPLLLVLGYCVIVPWAIIRRSKNHKGD